MALLRPYRHGSRHAELGAKPTAGAAIGIETGCGSPRFIGLAKGTGGTGFDTAKAPVAAVVEAGGKAKGLPKGRCLVCRERRDGVKEDSAAERHGLLPVAHTPVFRGGGSDRRHHPLAGKFPHGGEEGTSTDLLLPEIECGGIGDKPKPSVQGKAGDTP
jgi:hypothetical protein